MKEGTNIGLWRAWLVLVIGAILYSCASVGRLEGGEMDFEPPVLKSSNPKMGSVNQKNTKRFTLEFDEYIKLDKPGEKIVFSPPQIQAPEIKASGKKVIVNLKDTMLPNTTYTIDFADAIQDNNESNPLTQFTYTFSTGEELDTLAVAGTVLNAADLEPIKGVVVGLYADLSDTVFQSKPFERMGRSDSRGYFSIRGIAPGKYHVFALQDADQNYMLSQATEQLAFSDSLIIPTSEPRMRTDTVWLDSLTVDTLIDVNYTYFMPDDIILRNFKQLRPNRRMAGFSREVQHIFKLNFTAPADSLPVIEGLNFDADSAFVVELHEGVNDTLQYWIKDSLLIKMDTLRMVVHSYTSDSLFQLQPSSDTLNVIFRQRPPSAAEKKAAEQAKKEEERRRKNGDTLQAAKPAPQYLSMEVYAPSSLDIYDYLSLTFKEPVLSLDTAALHVQQEVDSLWNDIPFEFEQDSLDIKVFNIYADWSEDGSYRLMVDSAAVTGLYGLTTNKAENKFKIKPLTEYGQLFYTVTGIDTTAFVELLDERDNVVRTTDLVDGHADFYYLAPGKYGARIIVDENQNGRWDTGEYEHGKRQPEMVYYYHQILELKANFDIYQEWNVHELPLDKQKPDEMKKQKPETNNNNRRNQNAHNQRNNNNSSNRNQSSGFGF